MRNLVAIHDPTFHKKTQANSIDRFFLRYIKDERDLPFIYLCLKITFLVIPIAILLFTPLLTGWQWWGLATFYAALVVYFVGPYTLMLHNTSHRQFFKARYKTGNLYIPWVLGPFMGQSPETYFSHHIGMHHAENNLHADKSSTMAYQRDSIVDFMRYFFSFLLVGIIELVDYFRKKQRPNLAKKVIRGEFAFVLLCLLLSLIHWQATLYVLVLPLVIVRFSMMAGNWGQHAFIDEATPANNYRNSITCINNAYNRKCFNDGYHIGHHLRPHMHWTEMPVHFMKNRDKYAKERAIVFEGLDFHMVWGCLMLKRYDILAQHFVNLGNLYTSKEEVITLLKNRTKKIAGPRDIG